MIEEIGIVTKVEGSTARVAVEKRGACDGCTAKGTCEAKGDSMEIEAVNRAQALVGQKVKIAIQAQTYLKGTMLVYGLPLVLFIAGAIAGKNIGALYFKETNSDFVAALGGFCVLILSLLGVRVWAKRTENRTEYKPVIEEIVE